MQFSLSRHSLRTQIAVVFGALVALLALVLSLVFGELTKLRIEREASSSLQIVAHNAAKTLSDGLFERSREAQALADSNSVWENGLDTPAVKDMLHRSQATQPHNIWIGITDAEGTVRSATGDLLVGRSTAQRPWFIHGKETLYVGDVHPAKLLEQLLPPTSTGEPHRFVDFSAPIRMEGALVGVVGIHGSWQWTRSVMESLTPARTTDSALELFIFNRQRELIFAPNGQTETLQKSGETLPGDWVPVPTRTGDEGPSQRSGVMLWSDGRQYLTAITPLIAQIPAMDLGWTIVAREPVEHAFAEARATVFRALAIGLCAALLASMLAWLLARRLSVDLYTLAKAAQAVQAEPGTIALPQVHSNREVRQLSGALTAMTDRLHAAHEVLEEKVRARTRELEAANAALDQQARTDMLTGLLNRRGFETQISAALALAQRGKRPLSVIAIDVDHFKRVNDNFGHDVGDAVLRRLGHTLAARLRVSDVVARLGGEEFVALLPDTDETGAATLAQILVDAMAEQSDPVVGTVTISAGVASWPPGRVANDSESTQLLRRADLALYEAKRQGRNRVCTAPLDAC